MLRKIPKVREIKYLKDTELKIGDAVENAVLQPPLGLKLKSIRSPYERHPPHAILIKLHSVVFLHFGSIRKYIIHQHFLACLYALRASSFKL